MYLGSYPAGPIVSAVTQGIRTQGQGDFLPGLIGEIELVIHGCHLFLLFAPEFLPIERSGCARLGPETARSRQPSESGTAEAFRKPVRSQDATQHARQSADHVRPRGGPPALENLRRSGGNGRHFSDEPRPVRASAPRMSGRFKPANPAAPIWSICRREIPSQKRCRLRVRFMVLLRWWLERFSGLAMMAG